MSVMSKGLDRATWEPKNRATIAGLLEGEWIEPCESLVLNIRGCCCSVQKCMGILDRLGVQLGENVKHYVKSLSTHN